MSGTYARYRPKPRPPKVCKSKQAPKGAFMIPPELVPNPSSWNVIAEIKDSAMITLSRRLGTIRCWRAGSTATFQGSIIWSNATYCDITVTYTNGSPIAQFVVVFHDNVMLYQTYAGPLFLDDYTRGPTALGGLPIQIGPPLDQPLIISAAP